jgi:predicted cupin superfamily sugar epimerase
VTVLGAGIEGMRPQHVVVGDTWQGSRLREGGSWALMGTTMAPGFSFDDYEEGDATLAEAYPDFADHVRRLLPVPHEE